MVLQMISLEPRSTNVRVLVADSTPLTGQLIADALRKDRGLTVTNAEANSVIVTAATLKPDVAIISEQLQGKPGKGFEILRELRVTVPGTRTVMLLDAGARHLLPPGPSKDAYPVRLQGAPGTTLGQRDSA